MIFDVEYRLPNSKQSSSNSWVVYLNTADVRRKTYMQKHDDRELYLLLAQDFEEFPLIDGDGRHADGSP